MKKRLSFLLFLIILLNLTAICAEAASERPVRVGLRYGSGALDAANLENAVGSGYAFGYYDAERVFVPIEETEERKITMRPAADGGIEIVRTGTDEVLYTDEAGGEYLAVLPKGTEDEKTETWFKGYRYNGGFEYRRGGDGRITVINVADLEDYVKGVIPYEMSGEWPLEALKAQAVCARTYASRIRHASQGFDVCNTTDCQVYYGCNKATERSDQAVDETAGELLYYDGEIVASAVYCSSNGGATEDVENVWGGDAPYLRGKLDPYEAQTKIPSYTWTVTYTADQLTYILEQKGYRVGTVKNVYVAEYTPRGNVCRLTFEGSDGNVTVKGNTCSSIFYSTTYNQSVKSLRFTINGVTPESGKLTVNPSGVTISSLGGLQAIGAGGNLMPLGESAYVITSSGKNVVSTARPAAEDGVFTISGSGSGHNLGLSQYGAKAMAELGYSYLDILHFYYTDVTVG